MAAQDQWPTLLAAEGLAAGTARQPLGMVQGVRLSCADLLCWARLRYGMAIVPTSACTLNCDLDMKPRERKPEIVYRIISRKSGQPCGSYSRACCDEYDFYSPEEARESNVHGMFKPKWKYAIAKYRVTYELLDPDVDGPAPPTPPLCECNGGSIMESIYKTMACDKQCDFRAENALRDSK